MPRNFKTFSRLLLVPCLIVVGATYAVAQEKPEKDPKPPKIKTYPPMPNPGAPGYFRGDGVTSEKSMLVDPKVAIRLCVAGGDLRINGWHRDEVRVFVRKGRHFRLKALENSGQQGRANWLWIGSPVEGRPSPGAECLAGDSIEVDAPLGASFDIGGTAMRVGADSVKSVKVELRAGSIMLRNVTGGISAYTWRGDVMVESSGGAISLENTTGNIVAVEVTPGQIGDQLKAKTQSGAISFQRVKHRQIEASSISGSLIFDGEFLKGGIYKFRTSNGSIILVLPATSSCTLTATYGAGAFHSEIPLKTVTENVTPQAKVVVSKMGTGDATVNITTSNGSIGIKRQAAMPKTVLGSARFFARTAPTSN